MFVVFSGPTAVGKTSILKRIQEERKGKVSFPVSYTTRTPRPGENHQSYHFISKEQFQMLISNYELMEWTERASGLYGTSWAALEDAPSDLLLLDLDIAGAFAVRSRFPSKTCLVFVAPPPPEIQTIERRLRLRNDNMSENEIRWRLEAAAHELKVSSNFDHVVVNDNLEKAVQQVLDIIDSLTVSD